MAEQHAPSDAPKERLDELEERIDKARRQAEDEVPGMDAEDESRYDESGDTPPEEDDQTPPAG